MRTCLALLAAMMLSSAAVAAESAPDIGQAIVQWKEAVESRDSDAIVALYDSKAIMISTFAQAPLASRAALKAYYKQVVQNPDIKIDITEQHPRRFGDIAINSGQYTLSYTQEGEDMEIPARFSFVYQLKGGKWVIVDHHSSGVPTEQQYK
ncbi:MAG: nuclear transport factor 2 family protein [Rickettsiales bacterium]|nr:nuclear transport factor 2 family protein [Rickettsiales bacterium]